MKISIWDILTGLTLLGILCLVGIFGTILLNPNAALNPLQPPTLVPPIVLPSPTNTAVGLPPTWTPTPSAVQPEVVQPTLRPSRTPEPSATPVILPTFTPSRTVRVGPAAQGGGRCSVIYQSPEDGTVFAPGTPFTMRWTLKNNSDTDWRSDSIDLRFMSGDRIHMGADIRDLPYSTTAGGAIDILVDMRAPTGEGGTYTSNWALLAGSNPVCRFYVTIEVDD